MNNWNDLSLKEKADVMKVAIDNGIYNLSDIRKTYNEYAEGGPEEILNKVNSSDANFVQRLKDPNRKYIQDWESNNIATHKLSVGTDEYGNNYIYPEVQEINGKLVDFTRPPYAWYAGMESAEQRGDTVRVQNLDDAIRFTEEYKNYYPKGETFANGGKIHIKPSHRGKFTRLKERTGHSASWFKKNGTPAQKKMATFALNARKWKHGDGGPLIQAANSYAEEGPYKPGTIYGRPVEEGLEIVSPEFDALMLGRIAGNAVKETAGKLLNNGIAEAPTDEVLDTAVKRAVFTGQEFKKNATNKVKDIGDWVGYMRTNIRNKDYKNALFDAGAVARRAVNTGAYILGTPGRFVNNVIPKAYRPFYREWYATVKPTFPAVLTGHDYSE